MSRCARPYLLLLANSIVGQKMVSRTFINQHCSFQLVPQSQWINQSKHKERKQLHPEKQSLPNVVLL